ncbi:unnamed protein product [Meloidogyne enterolobii]|uniref:Uncharacterized protein n=1 Tax=Meloidogyne enterolobii TaxID=390850 RepID=A0ACB1AN88_MELEN
MEKFKEKPEIRRKGRGVFTTIPGITHSKLDTSVSTNVSAGASASSDFNLDTSVSTAILIPAGAVINPNLDTTVSNKEVEIDKILEKTEEEKGLDPKEVTESMEKLLLEEDMETDEWEKSQTWGEEEKKTTKNAKIPKFANEGFAALSHPEEEEFKEVKRKEKKKEKSLDTSVSTNYSSLDQTSGKDLKVKRYVIAQMLDKKLIAVYPNPTNLKQWPLFMEIPDELKLDSERPLCLGDSVIISKYNWIEGRREIDTANWMFQSRINAQAIALEILDVSLAPWVFNTGFVVDIKKRKGKEVKNTMGSALVVAFGMERTAKLFNRQCAEDLDFENLQRGSLLDMQLAKIPEGQRKFSCSSYSHATSRKMALVSTK